MNALDFDLDLDSGMAAKAPSVPSSSHAPAKSAPAEVKLNFDLELPTPKAAPVADMDFQIEIPKAESAPPPALDMSGIDLNLDSGVASDDNMQSDSWQEMTTKLDLAKAYLEIGDKEGAEELLQEVVTGGDAGQVTRARGMLAQLS
jgi:pilus assembly protein FimV